MCGIGWAGCLAAKKFRFSRQKNFLCLSFAKDSYMSEIQNDEARRLLKVIKTAWREPRYLTYQSAAEGLGRPKNHARTVAQMCDLLDASAALAGIPLIALIAVTEKSGKVNRDAWKNDVPDGIRERIIENSRAHRFLESDFDAIERAMDDLKGLGNRKAWQLVKARFGTQEIFLDALTNSAISQSRDALDDIGSDSPEKLPSTGFRYARDENVRRLVLRRANGECEYCGRKGFQKADGNPYIETHHIIALAQEGADRESNVIGLCAEHHREAHFGANRDRLETKMKEIVAR